MTKRIIRKSFASQLCLYLKRIVVENCFNKARFWGFEDLHTYKQQSQENSKHHPNKCQLN